MATTNDAGRQPASVTAELRSAAISWAPWVPAIVVVTVMGAWAFGDGGYFPNDWYPATLGFVALLATIALAVGRVLPAQRAARIALLLFTGLTAWSYLSVLYAGSAASAWEQSSKLLLVLVSLALLALPRWTGRSVVSALGVWAAIVALACLSVLIAGLSADDLRDFVVTSRWDKPLGYPNAAGALAATGFWAAMTVAVRGGIPGWVRIAFFAIAVFVIEFSLIPQSRGAMISLVAMTPVFIALIPDRLRAVSRLLIAGAAVALTASPIFDVYSAAAEERPVIPVLHHAAGVIGLAVAAAVLACALLELFEAARPPSPATVRRSARVVFGAGGVIALVALAIALVNAGSIYNSVNDRWHTFKSTDDTNLTIETGPRFDINQADQRYDYWRVSLNLFKEEPLTGVGSGNFERRYNAVRREEKPSRFPHQMFLRFLGENGIVGFLLFVGYLGVAIGGAVRFARRAGLFERAAVAGAVTLAGGFLLHSCFDWIDQFPTLVVPALGFPLAALIAVAPRDDPAGAARRAATWARARVATIIVVTCAALFTLGASWMSVRYLDRANAEWRLSPKHAFRDLDRADNFNPLTPTPRLTEGSISIQLSRPARARTAFEAALDREDNWYSWFELALLDAQAGRFARAKTEIAKAAKLNASDPFVIEARRQIAARNHIDPASFNGQVRGLTLFKEKPVR